MATNSQHLNSRGAPHLGLAAVLVAVVAAFAAPQATASYGWPVKPFHAQHPVRGFFGDPRLAHERTHGSFHFGVDVSAPDGTPVYATLTGTAILDPANPETVYVRADADDDVLFAYWHVVRGVRDGQHVVAYKTVIGWISEGWEHVHFAELRDGRYINPLRPGAMAPFRDHAPPRVHTFSVELDGRPIGRSRVRHGVDLVAEVRDETPLPVAGRWLGRPVMASLVRWCIRGRNGYSTGWRTAADFRLTIPADNAFGTVYARWTRQNKPWRNGRYRIVLARDFATGRLAPGTYRVEIAATDIRGNTGRRAFAFEVGRDGQLQPHHR